MEEPKNILCGTPQGGILSPFLFLVMMADIQEYIAHSSVEGYADDVNSWKNRRRSGSANGGGC